MATNVAKKTAKRTPDGQPRPASGSRGVRKNERRVEALVETALIRKGFPKEAIEYQGSDDRLIADLLPSKSGNRPGKGRPEFIIPVPGTSIYLVVEVKDGTKAHSSLTLDDDPNICALNAPHFAEDGVIHYMRGKPEAFPGLREKYDTIGLAISAERNATKQADLRVSVFRARRQGPVERIDLKAIPSPEKCRELIDGARNETITTDTVRQFAATLHDFLRDEMELSKDEKPLLISAIMLALKTDFRLTYYKYADPEELADHCYQSVEHYLKRVRLENTKREAMMETYRLLKSNRDVRKNLSRAVQMVDRELGVYISGGQMSRDSFDIMGHFYREFLRYTGGDKQNLGIVLTPKHICELFVALADPDPEQDTVIDICAGTGGFLVAAMAEMLRKCDGDTRKEEIVKKKRIGGIEKRPNMFTVVCSNMILRGDGKSNIVQGDAINEPDVIAGLRQLRPRIALLNPPFSKAKEGQHEFAFVKQSLDILEKGGTCIALVPMAIATGTDSATREWKRRLLEKHSLDAVFSLPDSLFPSVGVVTCGMVFRAHVAHSGRPTWMALWKDDGLRLVKGDRIEIEPGVWEVRKAEWLRAYKERKSRDGVSVVQTVDEDSEWSAEAYLRPDYSQITEKALESALRKYALYCLSVSEQSADLSEEASDA